MLNNNRLYIYIYNKTLILSIIDIIKSIYIVLMYTK
jgi:hypothetical protein